MNHGVVDRFFSDGGSVAIYNSITNKLANALPPPCASEGGGAPQRSNWDSQARARQVIKWACACTVCVWVCYRF